MILIVGNSIDPVKSVVDEIQHMSDKKVVFFRADKCLDNEILSFHYTNGRCVLLLDIEDKMIDLKNITSVWYWKPILPKLLRTIQPVESQTFIYRQFLAMWRSIVSLLANSKWINDYYKSLEVEHKPYQIQAASQIGFKIPDTLITSNPQRAMDFWKHCNKEMIIKALILSSSENKVIFTNKVTDETIQKIERLKSSPVILQKLVPHKYELRITVVGDKIFPAKIEGKSQLDWRRDKIKIEPCKLPFHIEKQCFKLVKKLGLQYGCIDMLVTPDNEYIFLEINPNGQWDFVEKFTGMKIGKAIAHLLM